MQAWHSVVRSTEEQVRRFLVLLESDRRNVRQYRREHPDTDMLLFTCVAAVVLGVLIVRL